MSGGGPASTDTPAGGPVFADAFRWIIEAEGGPRLVTDTGGLTRWGISSRAHPHVDIEHLTRDQAEAIYLESYWRPIRGSALPAALALVIFDAAVNMGVGTSVKILQTVLRNVSVDGVAGPETVAASKLFLPRAELVALCLELRLRWYADLAGRDEAAKKLYGSYLYGWRMRVMRLALEAGRWRGL